MGNFDSTSQNKQKFFPSQCPVILGSVVHTDALHELNPTPAVEYEDTGEAERKS